MSVKKDARIDEKIAAAAAFARPILNHLRKLVHQGCPDAEETIKWGRSTFVYEGRLLCGMVAFKEHCGFGFWHPKMSELVASTLGNGTPEEGSGQFGRLTKVTDLPDDATMQGLLAQAMLLNASDQPAARSRPKPSVPRPEATVPADLAARLEDNAEAAAVFKKFSPTQRRDYIEWLEEAKREETRLKRLDQTLEWLAEGKSRHWKYANC